MDEWLCKRLTPAKQKLGKWTGLSHVLEGIWEKWPMPELDRYQRLRNSFTADDQDLAKQIAQMGDYFSYELPNEESRAISLAWRRLELQYKDLELILRSLFRRHFGLIDAEWWPIFAPVDQPYGTLYVPAGGFTEPENKNVPPDGYFLTSRGYLAANIASMSQLGLDRESFYNIAYPLVIRTKPIDRIFWGFLYYIYHDVDFECWTDYWREIARRDFTLPYDEDVFGGMEIDHRVHESKYNTGFDCLNGETFWHLDWFLPMELMGRYENDLPVDTRIPGLEGDHGYLWEIHTTNRRIYFDIGFSVEDVTPSFEDIKTRTHDTIYFAEDATDIDALYCERSLDVDIGTPEWHEDKYPFYDDVAADFAMCDLPIGGFYE